MPDPGVVRRVFEEMLMPLQPFNSQAWIPWPEAVTVASVRPNSSDIVATTTAGVHRLGGNEAAPSRGVYTKYDALFTLGQDDLPFTPKPRDTIAWKGNTYTVLSVDGSDLLKFWRLTARDLVLAADLQQTGTLSRPSGTQDETGRAALTTYTDVAANIPCRVQPMGGQAGDVLDRKTIAKRYTTLLGQQVAARAKDRFVCDGVTYTVTGVTNPERITDLMSLDLEEVL